MIDDADRIARRLALAGIHGYQKYLGWALGGHCRFVPSCSFYAEEAYQRGTFLRATAFTTWRLCRCHPLCRGGFDPVPDSIDRPDRVSEKPPSVR